MADSESRPDWVVVGRLHRVRGRIGELAGEIDSDQPGRAERLSEVLLQLRPSGSPVAREAVVKIERLWHHDGRPIFKFEGVDTISAAELWEGAEILVPPSERMQPAAGEYLDADIVGCELQDREPGAPTGRVVGTVESIDNYGGGPILTVRRADGRQLMVPFASAICHHIDVAAKLIRAQLPEGLEDL